MASHRKTLKTKKHQLLLNNSNSPGQAFSRRQGLRASSPSRHLIQKSEVRPRHLRLHIDLTLSFLQTRHCRILSPNLSLRDTCE